MFGGALMLGVWAFLRYKSPQVSAPVISPVAKASPQPAPPKLPTPQSPTLNSSTPQLPNSPTPSTRLPTLPADPPPAFAAFADWAGQFLAGKTAVSAAQGEA